MGQNTEKEGYKKKKTQTIPIKQKSLGIINFAFIGKLSAKLDFKFRLYISSSVEKTHTITRICQQIVHFNKQVVLPDERDL